MGTSTESKKASGKKLLFSSSTEAFFNPAVLLHIHWFVQCYKKRTNGSAAALSEPMAMQPTIAHQNIASGYISTRFAAAYQISSKEATHSMARNAVLIPISQGNEVTIVTGYITFRYFTRTASKTRYGNQYNHTVL